VEKVKAFEAEFLEYMELKHKDVLAALAQGKLSDEITGTIVDVAKEIVEKFK
jgi:F-type H+-transporting ATPase subunit alpha